jgi:hypothetical protein
MEENNNKNKKGAYRRMILIFRWFLVLPTLAWICICLIGLAVPEVKKTVDFDTGENREKAKPPSEFSSDYFKELETYYNDVAPFRSALITLEKNISSFIESPYNNGLRDSLVAMFHSGETKPSANESSSSVNLDDLFGPTTKSESSVLPAPSSEAVTTQAQTKETEDPAGSGTVSSEDVSETDPESEALTGTDPIPVIETVTETDPAQTPTSADVVITPPTQPTNPGDEIDTTSYFPPVIKNNNVLIGRGDWLFLYGEGNINYYLANNLATQEELNAYLAAYKALSDACKNAGKKLAIILAPCKEQVYSEYMPTLDVLDQYKKLQRMVDYVNANSDVPISYPINELKALKSYYRVYLKYDTHWNSVGAYMAYQIMMRMLGMPMTSILNLNVLTEPFGWGDLILLANLNLADYTNDILYYVDYKPEIQMLTEEGKEDAQTERGVYHMTSNAPDNGKTLLIGDSYRNAMLNFVYKDFSDVYSTHWKNLPTAEVQSLVKNANTILLVYTERNEYQLLADCVTITDLLKQ